MAEALAAQAAFLGLTPRTADRLNPAEMEALLNGQLLRWGRHTRLAAWFMDRSIPFIAHAVAMGINAALGGGKLPRLLDPSELLSQAPDYRIDDSEDEEPEESEEIESPFEAPEDDDWEDEELS